MSFGFKLSRSLEGWDERRPKVWNCGKGFCVESFCNRVGKVFSVQVQYIYPTRYAQSFLNVKKGVVLPMLDSGRYCVLLLSLHRHWN